MSETYLSDQIQKPHFAIRVSNTLTYLQRKAWALLYLNARNDLDDDFHYVHLSVVSNTLEAHHDKDLKTALTKLSSTAVTWNITNDDGCVKNWTTSAMVGSSNIVEGTTVLRYEFTKAMKELFRANPNYATLEISVMNRLKSKHALALWEFCKIFVGTQSGSTGWKTVEEWRGIFGIQKGKYQRFKDFSNYVINKAFHEVNELSDITVKPEYKRSRRSVSEIRFVLKRNTKEIEKLEKTLEESKIPQFAWLDTKTKAIQKKLEAEFDTICKTEDPYQRKIEWGQYLAIKMKKDAQQLPLFLN